MDENGIETAATKSKTTHIAVYLLSMISAVVLAVVSSPDSRKRIGGLLHPDGHGTALESPELPIVLASEPPALPAPEPHFENAQLLDDHTPGWHKLPHAVLAVPTWAPAMVAFGLVFLALGVVTMWPLSVIGAIIFVLAITKWMRELLHA